MTTKKTTKADQSKPEAIQEPGATLDDGMQPAKKKCGRCGGDVGQAPLTEAVTVSFLTADKQVGALYLCLRDDKTHDKCAQKVIGGPSVTKNLPGDDGLTLFDPAAEDAT